MPEAATVAEFMLGLWLVEVKLFGPVQLNDVPLLVVPVRFSVEPAQIGVLLEAEAVGTDLTVTVTMFEESIAFPVLQVTFNR